MSLNREGTMYANGRNMRGSSPQGRMMQDGRGMRSGTPQGRMATDGRGIPGSYRRDAKSGCAAADAAEECGCRNIPDIPAGSRTQLLTYIDEVSFCAYDLMLYLDTHPEDKHAIEYFESYSEKRSRAVEIYEKKFGPLQYRVMDLRNKSISEARQPSGSDSGQQGPQYGQTCQCNMGSVKWVTEPWPWEGGEC